ncbi:MAG: bifunctional hydroxymethylpyrimidine kinase/phosphomethylpyrimidine kinase [Longimicrobiales bacterium]
MPMPVALTIAGSDSGGGAGIQADLKTFHAFGVFGTSALTAITAQDTLGVHGVHAIPVDMVRRQIRVVAEDLAPAACKTGMLATAELVETVADAIRALGLANFVLDPVMVATSGDRLLDRDAEAAVTESLLPLATVVTPNLDEARILAGREIRGVDDMRAAAELLVERGARAALVKGGHLAGDTVVDVLVDEAGTERWHHAKFETTSTHGTGCTLSSAIAAGLAHGRPLRDAVADALDFAHRAIAEAPGLGAGHGPLNHFVPARPGLADHRR